MRIQIDAGVAVMLTARTSTSVKGGKYDLARFDLSEADVKRVLATKGVSEIKPKKTEEGK